MRTHVIKYLIGGSIAAGTHLAMLPVLVELLHLNPTLATTIGFCTACLINYLLQYHWIFYSKQSHKEAASKYVGVTLCTMAINTTMFWTLHQQFRVPYFLAQVITYMAVLVINFQINRRYTFKAQ